METIAGKRVALVGGAGFIGHHLALRMKELGAEVMVLDGLQVNNFLSLISTEQEVRHRDLYLAFITERIDLLHRAGVHVAVHDARDYLKLSQTLGSWQPEVLVHLAAVAHADRSNKDPYSTFDHSLRTLENSLDFSRPKSSVRHFIYFSSSMVYGDFPEGGVIEETPCNPIGIYGALKLSGEKLVIAYNQVFGIPYTIVRPSALYGPRCISRRVGQIFIESALQNAEITVRGDGTDALDFTYVDDLVQGIVRVIGSGASRNQTFNLTCGRARSIGEMADILGKHFPGLKVSYLPKDRLMPDRGTLSVEKARRLLGYEPRFPLERGLADYIAWYRTLWARFSPGRQP